MSKNRSGRTSNRTAVRLCLKNNGGVCHWCGRPIMMMEKIPIEKRLHHNQNHLVYIDKQGEKVKTVKTLIATADHIVPRNAGGKNGKDNVVASCFSCNHSRNDKDQKKK